MIFTFYSFKGGVGRSMMLANVAELLYQHGLKVLMIDFDLEAPGLERFFSTPSPLPGEDGRDSKVVGLPAHADFLHSRGVLDLLLSYKVLRALPTNTGTSEPSTPAAPDLSIEDGPVKPKPFPYRVEPLKNFIVPVREPSESNGGSLSLMTAGRRDKNEYTLYADRIRAFDWEDFFVRRNGAEFFEWFGDELNKQYEIILIDSRTGITEMSGVCTHFLADSVVLLVAANDQNLEGTERIANSLLREELKLARPGRDLSLLIVPSRVEINEGDKLTEFSGKFADKLSKLIDRRIKFQDSAFLNLRVPYIPFYAFGENVAVRDAGLPVAADMIAAATNICSAMFELVPKENDIHAKENEIYAKYQAAQTKLVQTTTRDEFERAPKDFSGRDWVFDRIEAWLRRSDAPALLIVGAPGSGKTALAARIVEFARGVPPPGLRQLGGNALILAHSCTRGNDWRPFLEALAQELAERSPQFAVALARLSNATPEISVRIQSRIGTSRTRDESAKLTIESISIAQDISADRAFRQIIQKPLQEAANSGKLPPLMLLLVDGLDVALDGGGKEGVAEVIALAAQPGALPLNFRLLAFSRPDPRIVQIMTGPKIDLSEQGKVGPDIAAYSETRLKQRLRGDERSEVVAQIERTARGNFLYAKLLLDGLLADDAASREIVERIDNVLDPERMPETLRDAFVTMVKQLVGFNVDRWSRQYRPLLGVLAVARSGLTLTQLSGITRRPQSEVVDSLRALGSFLASSTPGEPYRLFHPVFGTFMLSEPEYGVSSAEAHEAIAMFYLAEYERDWQHCEPASVLADTPYHLLAATRESQDRRKRQELLGRLVDLLLDPAYVEARVTTNSPGELQDDVEATIELVIELGIEHPRYRELRELDSLLVPARREVSPARRAELARSWRQFLSAGPENGEAGNQSSVPVEQVLKQVIAATAAGPLRDDVAQQDKALREMETLRQQIPASVQIELRVWHQAQFNGSMMLLAGVALCGIMLPFAFGLPLFVNFPTDPLYGIILIATTYLLYTARFEAIERRRRAEDQAKEKAMEKEYPGPAAAPPEPQRWETLPEILELRGGGKRYRLLGDIAVASPYFELVLVLFMFTFVVATMSKHTSPWIDLFSLIGHPNLNVPTTPPPKV